LTWRCHLRQQLQAAAGHRAGERLLGRPEGRLLGFTAEELGLAACLEGEAAHTMELAFPGGSGRWGLRRGTFRQGGLPEHPILVVLERSEADAP